MSMLNDIFPANCRDASLKTEGKAASATDPSWQHVGWVTGRASGL